MMGIYACEYSYAIFVEIYLAIRCTSQYKTVVCSWFSGSGLRYRIHQVRLQYTLV